MIVQIKEDTIRLQFFIPGNKLGIRERYYSLNEIVALLRENKDKPEMIQFIADMLEE